MKPAPYGPFSYSPIIRRPKLTWPHGAQLALWVIPSIEFFSLAEKVPAGAGGGNAPVPDVPTWSSRDFGNRVGVFRLMQVMERCGIRGTVALNISASTIASGRRPARKLHGTTSCRRNNRSGE